MLAITLTRLIKGSYRIAEKLGTEQVSSVFLEFGDRLLLIQAQEDNQFLVVIATPGISLGRLIRHLGKGPMKEGSGA